MPNILIIGAAGQVGLSLIELCNKTNIKYIAISRRDLDIIDSFAVDLFFQRNHAMDFVINAAAYTAVDAAEQDQVTAYAVNQYAVKNLALCCKRYDIPLIHISTDYVFDGKKKTSYVETDSRNPLSIYGISKLAGEKELQNLWHKHIILRVSWIFSEYRTNFVKTMCHLFTKQEEISVVDDQIGCPTSAASVASVIINIIHVTFEKNEALWGVYHYSDFPCVSWYTFACNILSSVESKVSVDNIKTKIIHPISSSEYPLPAKRPPNSVLNIEKIQKIFGIRSMCWHLEIQRIIQFIYIQNKIEDAHAYNFINTK
ncbi:MAG: dTDP-4-dehydrorhamnose reductase [Gammaproteobacteria bacterium RIFCSPHIGHO2_12_FULL_36_30]|nr:MAG: dTDP-4-dehydrorhamnose reductase [Gammaproteobacteria bacterium RIFCSPHIGHO2_12_FULL_36_30]